MITTEEIKKIAQLSRLYVADDELEPLAREMSAIVALAGQVADAEAEEAPAELGAGLETLRRDVALPSPDRGNLLSQSQISDGKYFVLEVRRHG